MHRRVAMSAFAFRQACMHACMHAVQETCVESRAEHACSFHRNPCVNDMGTRRWFLGRGGAERERGTARNNASTTTKRKRKTMPQTCQEPALGSVLADPDGWTRAGERFRRSPISFSPKDLAGAVAMSNWMHWMQSTCMYVHMDNVSVYMYACLCKHARERAHT